MTRVRHLRPVENLSNQSQINEPLLVLTLDLLKPAIDKIGPFKVSLAPRKIPQTIELLSNETGVSREEIRKFIHGNSFALEMEIFRARKTAVSTLKDKGVSPKNIAAQLRAPLSQVYVVLHSLTTSSSEPVKKTKPQEQIKEEPPKEITSTRKVFKIDQIVSAILATNPFKCNDPPAAPTDRFIRRVCNYLGLSSRDVYSALIESKIDFPDLIRAARAQALEETAREIYGTGSDLANAISTKYDITIGMAMMNVRRYSKRD